MVVLYEQGLEDIASQLSAMGYHMHPIKAMIPADAVLYVSDPHAALSAVCAQSGAPLLCVRSMSAPQIAAAIRRRSVQPLF